MNVNAIREKKLVRTVVIGAALVASSLLGAQSVAAGVLNPQVDMGAPGGGGGSAVVDLDFAQTPNERSIALIESNQTESGALAGAPIPDFADTANGQSIARSEDKLPANGVLAGGEEEVSTYFPQPGLAGQPF
jgi:hypothetical protein